MLPWISIFCHASLWSIKRRIPKGLRCISLPLRFIYRSFGLSWGSESFLKLSLSLGIFWIGCATHFNFSIAFVSIGLRRVHFDLLLLVLLTGHSWETVSTHRIVWFSAHSIIGPRCAIYEWTLVTVSPLLVAVTLDYLNQLLVRRRRLESISNWIFGELISKAILTICWYHAQRAARVSLARGNHKELTA